MASFEGGDCLFAGGYLVEMVVLETARYPLYIAAGRRTDEIALTPAGQRLACRTINADASKGASGTDAAVAQTLRRRR